MPVCSKDKCTYSIIIPKNYSIQYRYIDLYKEEYLLSISQNTPQFLCLYTDRHHILNFTMPAQTFIPVPIPSISHDFDRLNLSEDKSALVTPTKSFNNDTHVISPSSFSSDDSISIRSEDSSLEDDSPPKVIHKKITVSAHKQLELDGKHLPEPILMDNPGRFVLFPIQNQEVSTIAISSNIYTCLVICHPSNFFICDKLT